MRKIGEHEQLLHTAAHELAHCAAAIEYGVAIDSVDVIRTDGRLGLTRYQHGGPLTMALDAVNEIGDAALDADDALATGAMEFLTSACGVTAILNFAGQVANQLLGLDHGRDGGAGNDNQRAWQILAPLGCSMDDATFLYDQACHVVEKYWPRILQIAPILADHETLDGAHVTAMLKGSRHARTFI
jgi:hypothetical protein